ITERFNFLFLRYWRGMALAAVLAATQTSTQGDTMKTQIQFKQADGDDGIALVEGPVNRLEQAKRELANKLDLPATDTSHGNSEDIDARLRHGGINPESITFSQVAE